MLEEQHLINRARMHFSELQVANKAEIASTLSWCFGKIIFYFHFVKNIFFPAVFFKTAVPLQFFIFNIFFHSLHCLQFFCSEMKHAKISFANSSFKKNRNNEKLFFVFEV